jgi:hypothetical protein
LPLSSHLGTYRRWALALDLELSTFAIAIMGSVGAIGLFLTLFFISQNSRDLKLLGGRRNNIHLILDGEEAVLSRVSSPFLAMPDDLKTHDDMIAWMTGELPKLTVDLMRSRT